MSEKRRSLLHKSGLPLLQREVAAPAPPRPRTTHPREAALLADRAPALALLATRDKLPFADVAAATFLAHHPGFRVFLLLIDGTEADRDAVPPINVVLPSDLDIPDFGWLTAKLDASELSNTLKPNLLIHLARFTDTCVYMDCDIAVFAPFTSLLAALKTSSLVLIPHMFDLFPRPEMVWLHPNDADMFNSGLINAGCFGIDLKRSAAFLEFWRHANAHHAWLWGGGRQTDQQHLNWALINVPDVHVLRDRAYNVAYWNLHDRSLRRISRPDDPPAYAVDGQPLVFFHFSGYDPENTLRLSHHDQRYTVYTMPSVSSILEWYSQQIQASVYYGRGHVRYGFEMLGNGLCLSPFIRNLLKQYDRCLAPIDATTPEGADALCDMLMSTLPATGSRLPLIAAAIYACRPDLREAYPDADSELEPRAFWSWFCCHAGEEYKIELLIARYRRAVDSDTVAGFVTDVLRLLPAAKRNLLVLGDDRHKVAAELKGLGETSVANTLLSCGTEWFCFSDFSAVLLTYLRRADLVRGFPDPFGASHAELARWLADHGGKEHGLPAGFVETFRQKSATLVLARLFSLLSRREELAQIAVDEMLSEKPARLVAALIREAGEGLEHDLADVEVFLYLHRHERRYLVPLYLELPPIRRRTINSRTAEGRRALLPVAFDQDWVAAGCRMHEQSFSEAEAAVEQEIRNLHARMDSVSTDVISLLQSSRLTLSAAQLTRLAEQTVHRQSRFAPALAKPAARVEPGRPRINLFGYHLADTGVGESSRGLDAALSRFAQVSKIPQFTNMLHAGTKLEDLFVRYDHHADCNVFISYPHAMDDPLGLAPVEFTARRRNIIHLAWEQKDWNPLWRSVYSRYDEIWTISNFAAEPFREMLGPSRVRVVHNVLLVDDFPGAEAVAAYRTGRERFRFLFVFDANSSIERKNPEATLAAFIAAFKDGPRAKDVELVFKIGNARRAEHRTRLQALMATAAASGLAVTFDQRKLSRQETLCLIASSDAYVSLHRSEGFGYTLAEAMYYGVPVIASGYSGNLDYMSADCAYLVPCRETLVENPDGPFQRGSVWGEADVAAAAAHMRAVVGDQAAAKRVGALGAARVRALLTPQVVADGLKEAFGPSGPPALQQAGE